MVHYDRVWQFDQIPTGTGASFTRGTPTSFNSMISPSVFLFIKKKKKLWLQQPKAQLVQTYRLTYPHIY